MRVNPSPDPDPGPAVPDLALVSFPLGEETLTLLTSRAIECGLMGILVTAVAMLKDSTDWVLLWWWWLLIIPDTPGSTEEVVVPV